MVKRKARISLDEWLEQGARLAETPTTKEVEAPVEQPCTLDSAIASADSESQAGQSAAAEPAVGPSPAEGNQSHVTEVESEAHAWFWSILEQAGYERW